MVSVSSWLLSKLELNIRQVISQGMTTFFHLATVKLTITIYQTILNTPGKFVFPLIFPTFIKVTLSSLLLISASIPSSSYFICYQVSKTISNHLNHPSSLHHVLVPTAGTSLLAPSLFSPSLSFPSIAAKEILHTNQEWQAPRSFPLFWNETL